MQRGQLAEAVPGGAVRLDAERPQHPQCGQRTGDDPRLRHFGGGLVAGDRQARRAVDVVRDGESAAQRARATRTGALSGEQVSDFRR